MFHFIDVYSRCDFKPGYVEALLQNAIVYI